MADETTPASALKSHDDVSGGPSAANNVSTSALDRSDSSWAKARIAELEAAISQLKLDKQEENDLWEKQRKEQQDQLVKRQADLEAREFEMINFFESGKRRMYANQDAQEQIKSTQLMHSKQIEILKASHQSEIARLTKEHATAMRLQQTRLKEQHQAEVNELQRQAIGDILDTVAARVTRLQATIAEAASHAHLSVSWTPPVDGNELAEQFHEMETWIGHVAEAGDMVRQELKALQASMDQLVAERKELHNKLVDMKGAVRVFCRQRMLSEEEAEENPQPATECDEEESSIAVYTGRVGGHLLETSAAPDVRKNTFTFDRVFGPQSSQETIFTDLQPIIQSCLDGYNVCIFAYGQTCSGKTYTLQGTAENPGVTSHALSYLFKSATSGTAPYESFTMALSMLEIYNDAVFDLLTPSSEDSQPAFGSSLRRKTLGNGTCSTPGSRRSSLAPDSVTPRRKSIGRTEGRAESAARLDVRSDASGARAVGAHEREVWSQGMAQEVLNEGYRRRQSAAMASNRCSSRSHCLVCITVNAAWQGKQCTSKIWLVDLAGSERLNKSHATGERLKEAQHINRSLSSLADCIAAKCNKAKHVPYRNSKLTHLLQDSLAGGSKVVMLLTVNPCDKDAGETLCSLNFAARLRGLELGPVQRNIRPTDGARQIELQQQLDTANTDVADALKRVHELEEQVAHLQEQLTDQEAQREASSAASMKEAKDAEELRGWLLQLTEDNKALRSKHDGLKESIGCRNSTKHECDDLKESISCRSSTKHECDDLKENIGCRNSTKHECDDLKENIGGSNRTATTSKHECDIGGERHIVPTTRAELLHFPHSETAQEAFKKSATQPTSMLTRRPSVTPSPKSNWSASLHQKSVTKPSPRHAITKPGFSKQSLSRPVSAAAAVSAVKPSPRNAKPPSQTPPTPTPGVAPSSGGTPRPQLSTAPCATPVPGPDAAAVEVTPALCNSQPSSDSGIPTDMLLATTIPGNIKIDVRTPALHETPALVEAESDKENAMDTGTSRQNGNEPDSLDRLIARARTPSKVLARNAHVLLNKPTPASRQPITAHSKQANSQASPTDASAKPCPLTFAAQEDHAPYASPLQSSVANAVVHASPRGTPSGPTKIQARPRLGPQGAQKAEGKPRKSPLQPAAATEARHAQHASPRASHGEASKAASPALQTGRNADPKQGGTRPSPSSTSGGHKPMGTRSSSSTRLSPADANKRMTTEQNSPRMSPRDPRKPAGTPSSLAASVNPKKLALALPTSGQRPLTAVEQANLRLQSSADTPRPGTDATKSEPLPHVELPSVVRATYSETLRSHIERCRSARAEREALSESLSLHAWSGPVSFGSHSAAQPSSAAASFWGADRLDASLASSCGGFGLRPSSVPGHMSQHLLSSSSSHAIGKSVDWQASFASQLSSTLRPSTASSLPNFAPSSFGMSSAAASLRDRPLYGNPAPQAILERHSATIGGQHAPHDRHAGKTQRSYFRSNTPRVFGDSLGLVAHPSGPAGHSTDDHVHHSFTNNSGPLQRSAGSFSQHRAAADDGNSHELQRRGAGQYATVQAVCTAGDEPQASSRKSLWASGSRRLSTDPERGYVRARAALFDSTNLGSARKSVNPWKSNSFKGSGGASGKAERSEGSFSSAAGSRPRNLLVPKPLVPTNGNAQAPVDTRKKRGWGWA